MKDMYCCHNRKLNSQVSLITPTEFVKEEEVEVWNMFEDRRAEGGGGLEQEEGVEVGLGFEARKGRGVYLKEKESLKKEWKWE